MSIYIYMSIYHHIFISTYIHKFSTGSGHWIFGAIPPRQFARRGPKSRTLGSFVWDRWARKELDSSRMYRYVCIYTYVYLYYMYIHVCYCSRVFTLQNGEPEDDFKDVSLWREILNGWFEGFPQHNVLRPVEKLPITVWQDQSSLVMQLKKNKVGIDI